MDQHLHTEINRLSPIEIIMILEKHGYKVNEEDTIAVLRETVRADVESGEVTKQELAFIVGNQHRLIPSYSI